METVLVILRGVRDPRQFNAQHVLADVLCIALVACLCGAQSCTEFEEFGLAKEVLLREFLQLPHGIPSHDTFSRVFRLIDPAELAGVLGRFAGAFGIAVKGVVAVDGKSLRGACAAGKKHMPPMTVSVWAQETRITLSQTVVAAGGEAAAAIAALKLLGLKGCVVTADALHGTAGMANAVIAARGDYILALKANQPALHRQAVEACAKPRSRPLPSAETAEEGHGRSEKRRAFVAPFERQAKRHGFPGLKAIGCIERQRTAGGKSTASPHYYLLSMRMPPSLLLDMQRKHWDIENGLHWRLDVVFDEDRARNRRDNGPANLAVLRRMTMNYLQSHPAKKSINLKRRRAAWDDGFLIEALTHMR